MNDLIKVDFRRSVPIFPLSDTVLLPFAVLPLHVFEPRYRQMVDRCLDGSGQIAMATYVHRHSTDVLAGESTGGDVTPTFDVAPSFDVAPPLRPAVCLGQVIAHERLSDGRFNIHLHGLCRGSIEHIIEPDDDRMFRMARLAPIGDCEADEARLPGVRDRLSRIVKSSGLQRIRGISTLQEWMGREEVPTHALVELIGFAIVRDPEMRYRLLAEPDPSTRARLVIGALREMESLVERAERQRHERWPKGESWN